MSQYPGHNPAEIVEALTRATTPLTLLEVTRAYAQSVVAAAGGNKSLAARQLGISRRTLYRVLAGQQINIPGPGDV